MKKTVIPLVALAVGVTLGYLVAGRGASGTGLSGAGETVPSGKSALADKGEAASLKALRARIADLERQLAEAKERKPSEEKAAEGQPVAANAEPPRGPEDFRARMEKLKETDPERYTQITNRMANWRQRRAERQQAKMEYLSSIDTSRMSPAARKTHADLQTALARREEIEQRLQDESLTDEQRRVLFMEIHDSEREIGRLNRQERGNLISATAKELGFKGDEVKEIAATMSDIIEATEGGRWGHGGHGGHRPPPPPAGGPR